MINNAAATGILENGLLVCFDIFSTYTIGGAVRGLAPGDSVVQQKNAADDLTVSADGSFTFPAALADGSPYAVTVLTQPAATPQPCTVTNGSATVASANVSTVEVTCIEHEFPWPMFTPAIQHGQTVPQ